MSDAGAGTPNRPANRPIADAALRRRGEALRRLHRGRRRHRSISGAANSLRCSGRPAAARPRCCAWWRASRRRTPDAFCSTAAISAATPPYDRPVNMMFQSYALFPHLTVAGNVAFGLKQEGWPKDRIEARVARDAGAGQARAIRASQAASIVRRPAPARRARPRAREIAQGVPARRAARRRSTRNCATRPSSS